MKSTKETSRKKKKQQKRERRRKWIAAAVCGALAVGCVVCGLVFKDNISSIPFWVGAALALLGLVNAIWRVIHRGILPILAVLCVALAVAGQLNYVTIDGHTYSTFLRTLDLSRDGITSLEGIERCRYLSSVNIRGLKIADVSPLEQLTGLKKIDMRGNPVSESQYDRLRQALPGADIAWSVPLGQSRADNDTAELTVTEKEYVTFDMFVRQLGYFDHVTRLDMLSVPGFEKEQAASLKQAFPDAKVVWLAPAGEGMFPSDSQKLTLTGFESGETLLEQLAWFEDLTALDIYDCQTTREEVETVMEGLEDVSLRWKYMFHNVPLSSDDTALDLYGVALEDTQDLTDVLSYAHNITSVNLTSTGLENAKLYALSQTFPEIRFLYTIDLFGVKILSTDESADLSAATVDDSAALAEALNYLTNLKTLDLGVCHIPSSSLAAIQKEHTELQMIWYVDLYGFPFRTDVDRISFNGSLIGDLSKLDDALEYMPNVKYIDLCHCGLPDASLAKFRDAHPDIKVVWIVNLGRWTLRTDATAFSTLDGTTNKLRMTTATMSPLQYCTELRALDMGHQQLTDISFLENLPELRILILADNRISDISVLRKLKHLQYVELFMNSLTDISPLAECTEMLDLNLCYNFVKDVTPIAKLTKLQRLWMSGNKLSGTTQTYLKNALPGCHCNFTVDSSTGEGWREHHRYDVLFDIFNNTKEYRDWDAE